MKVFLSHSSVDKDVVETIGVWLRDKGYSVWLDKWEMTPGDSLIGKIGEGIDNSDKLVVFLTEASVDSNWVKKEVSTGLVLEIAEKKGLGSKFVIPAILKNCSIPTMLIDKIYANFTDKPFDVACQELLNGIIDTPPSPLDAKFENKIFRATHINSVGSGKYALLVEYAARITPIQGLNIEINTGTKFTKYLEWIGKPDSIVVPNITGGIMFRRPQEFIEPPVFAKLFLEPEITSSKSYYVYFESDEPFSNLKKEITFSDYASAGV